MTNAVRFSASTMKYSRSASGLNTSTSITWCCWVKLAANRGTYSMVLASDNASANYVQLATRSDGVSYSLLSTSGGANSAYTFPVGTWVFIAATMDISGGNDYLYRAQAPATTLSNDFIFTLPTGWNDANTFYIGNGGYGDWLNGSVAAVKIWTAALTQTELETEMTSYAPVRTANLWAAYKFDAGPQTTDDSGNGRTLTSAGTPTLDSSGPPIGAGGTSYALTATGTGASTGSLAVAIFTPPVIYSLTGASTGSLAVGGLPTDLTGTGTGATTGSLAVAASSAIAATGTGTSTGTLAVTITSGPASLALASTGHGTTTGHLAVIRAGPGGGGGSGVLTSGANRGGYQPRNTPAERRAFFDHKRQLAKLAARIEALEP